MNNKPERNSLQNAIAVLCAFMMCLSVLASPAFALKAHAEPNDYQPPLALKTLWEQNHHVIGGLFIPGTAVCYPILQHPSIDDYYLNVSLDGTEGLPGSIYTNKVEGQNFNTFNTVIYGHNMRDGSYFGSLRLFRDPDYLSDHREIYVFGADAMHIYEIFAVAIYTDERITDYFPDELVEYRMAFLQSLQSDSLEDSILLTDVPVDPNNGHILTLSTCITDMPNNRLLIVAAEKAQQ